ncbi:hypothetical protein SAMN05880590_103119 [Rhizobium sp. RU35A]|uniref:Serine hydrolase family protein n=2 Tax=Rhizobium TaxID=379 RepID=A0A549TEL0_9HYPH|nr:alpha/beta hydrolase [Rhizobium straminoryzae]TRL40738.1 serine hydrolase family protein [Rhizobium straminoryzae]SIQ32238.1 hypothetical protein SAMN05880590_103119 [Rhizobium sp. RU35A]
MATTLILPGLYGSGDSHWQRIWAADCPDCEVVEQENWACPDLLRWADVLERRLADTQDAVHLVAHSLGCLLVAHLAASPVASRIRSAFLVAPCDMEAVETLHPCTVRLHRKPDIPLPFHSLVIGSENDPYMTREKLLAQAAIWGSDVKILGRVGHINVASGFGRWRAGYELFNAFTHRLAEHTQGSNASPSTSQKPPRIDLLDAVVTSGLSAIAH